MNDRVKTVIVRGIVIAFVLGIFVYIFYPTGSGDKTETTAPKTTDAKPARTSIPTADEPCLVLFRKNTAQVIDGSGICITAFAEKYVAGTYGQITVVCRSSADGNQQDRQLLSDNRASTVKITLIEKGVTVANIHTVSLGDKQPIDGSGGTDGKVINRSCVISGETK